MADLLKELQHVGGAAALRRRAAAVDSDPLLLDEVFTCSSSSTSPKVSSGGGGNGSGSGAVPAAGTTTTEAPFYSGSSTDSTSSKAGWVQPSGSSFTSGTTGAATSPALAALAAYRRQLHPGQDASTAATAGSQITGAGGGTGAGSPQLLQALTGRRSFVLKSRPQGMSAPDFGPHCVLGLLPRPCAPGELPVAQSGTGAPRVPPRLLARSCCPPPWREPLNPPSPDASDLIAAHQAAREAQPPDVLLQRLVYDSLQPPPPAGTADGDGSSSAAAAAAAAGRSSRATDSSCSTSTRSDSAGRGDAAAANAAAAAPGPAEGLVSPEAALHGGQGVAGSCMYDASLASWYVPHGDWDTTLVFESRFESGNLRRAVQVTEWEYDLILQPDLNTRGHTQWFFFALSNTRAGRPYRLNIINLLKPDSLYSMGMLPLVHSERQMQDKGVGWVRCAADVVYGNNGITCRRQSYHTLTFTLEFPHSHDLVHLAHCYPFTWTDQQQLQSAICRAPHPGICLQQACLATSLAGNAVDVLTITSSADRGKPLEQRQGVVLSARVHPGETNSSWMMKGALQQLLADTPEAAQLRDGFVFKVVPMLNPDGVIAGNYRCSLAGLDLNRVYQAPDARLQPVVYAFKEMVRAFTQEREVVLSCDMHGHSRRFGIFMYGCEKKPGKDAAPLGLGCPVPGSVGGLPGVPVRHQERIFPLMLAINAPDLFMYRSCNFKVQKSKAGTGRVVGFRELGLVNAFTLEASFAGPSVGKHAKQHFNTGHLEEMGAAVVRTLLDYLAPAEASSAPDLCTQLDAALLQGTAGALDGSSAAAGGGGGGYVIAAGPLAAFEGGADEEDACTDSDDESSDDDRPAAGAASATPAPASACVAAAKLQPAASSSSSSKDLGSSASSSSSSLAQLNQQLLDLLASPLAADAATGAVGSGGPKQARGLGAAAQHAAVAQLLAALKAVGPVAAGAASAPPAKGTLAGPAAAGTGNAGTSISSSSSSNSSVSRPAATTLAAGGAPDVMAAARQLLDKVVAAKARVEAGAASAAAPVSQAAAGATRSSCSPAASVGAAGAAVDAAGCLVVAADPVTGAPDAVAATAAARGAAMPVASTGVTQESATAALTAPATLSDEEAALLRMPGLELLLQQLLAEHASQEAAAKVARKKGRRRARWGSPEVLRAARAKADAGLAAALPELGDIFGGIVSAAAGVGACQLAASAPAPAAATAQEVQGGPAASLEACEAAASAVEWAPHAATAGRRARTAGHGSDGAKGSMMLNADRYMQLLEVQKRAVGGVLASSDMDSYAAGEGPSSSPHSFTCGSSSSSSSSSRRRMWPPGGSSSSSSMAGPVADATLTGAVAPAVAPSGANAATCAVATGASPQGGGAARSSTQLTASEPQRSKSAFPW